MVRHSGSLEAGAYVADFETTTNENDCRVWGWGIVPVSVDSEVDDCIVGTNLESFLTLCAETDHLLVYFHNLKFDVSFIVDWLLKHGFEHVTGKIRERTFTMTVSRMEQHYRMRVKWGNGNVTTYQDSLKKLPLSVAQIAKSFKLPLSKLVIDYDEDRPIGHELTKDEETYIVHDIVIVARALAIQLNAGMDKLTVGADSLAEFTKLSGGQDELERLFPVLYLYIDSDIRQAFKGGWTYCDPRRAGEIVGPGKVYDINSMYPYVMSSRVLPYGKPLWFSGEFEPCESYPLAVMSITFTAKIKEDHLPCIQVKGHPVFQSNQYLTEIDEELTMSMTSVDWELWNRHYDIDVLSYNGGWKFHGTTGLFDAYISKWYGVKERSEGGIKVIAKLHLNSLYGKLATNPDVTGKIPVLKDGCVHYVLAEPDTRDPVYTAMGCFITAYSRHYIVSAAQENYESFLYADTDSLHLLIEPDYLPDGMEIHPTKLGAWKQEKVFDYAVFWRAKQYCERQPDGTYETHIAGMPQSLADQVRFCDFYEGREFTGKLMARKVPGGTVLSETTFKLRAHV